MTTQPEELEARENTQRTLLRMAVLYVPLAFVTTAVALYAFGNFLGGAGGALIPAVIVGIFALAFSIEGISAVRDLRAQPVTSRGPVRRTWSRGGLLWFFRSHYMHVEKDVFTVAPLTAVSVHPGDTVEIEHWPHTKTVMRVRLLGHGSGTSTSTSPQRDPTRRSFS